MDNLTKHKYTGVFSKPCKRELSKRNSPKPADVDLQLNGKPINLSQRPAGLNGRFSARSVPVSYSQQRPMSAIPSHYNKTNFGSVSGWKRPQSADHSLPSNKHLNKLPTHSCAPAETSNQDRNYLFPQSNRDWKELDRSNLFSLKKPLSLSSLTDDSDFSHHVTTPRFVNEDSACNTSLRLNLTGHKTDRDNFSDFGATYTLPEMLERTWTEEELIRYCDEAEDLDSDDNFQSEASMGEKILAMAQRSATLATNSARKLKSPATQRSADVELDGSTDSLLSSKLELAERETDLLLKKLVEREQGPSARSNQFDKNSVNYKSQPSLSNKQLYEELNKSCYISNITEPYLGNESYRGEVADANRYKENYSPRRLLLELNNSNLEERELRIGEHYLAKDKYSPRAEDSISDESSLSPRSPRETESLHWEIPADRRSSPNQVLARHRNARILSARSKSVERNKTRKYEPPATSRSLSVEIERKTNTHYKTQVVQEPKNSAIFENSVSSQLSANFREEGPMSSGCFQDLPITKEVSNGHENDETNKHDDDVKRFSRINLLHMKASESLQRSRMLVDRFSSKGSSVEVEEQTCNTPAEDPELKLRRENSSQTPRQQSNQETECRDTEDKNADDIYSSENLRKSPCSKMLMLIDFEEQLVEPPPPANQRIPTYEEIIDVTQPLDDLQATQGPQHRTTVDSCSLAERIDVSQRQDGIQTTKDMQYRNTIASFLTGNGQETDRSSDNRCLKPESRNSYNDISDILKVLEQEEDAQNSARLANSISDLHFANQFSNINHYQPNPIRKPASPANPGNLVELLSYLDKVDESSKAVLDLAKSSIKSVQENTARQIGAEPLDRGDGSADLSVKLEDLLSLSVVDLAHMVFTLRFQMSDKTKSVHALKQALKEEREERQRVEYEAEKNLKSRLQEQKDHFENAVARHQKFIDQLICDKKALTSKVENVVDEMKALEARNAKSLKVLQERHAIEVKRAKDCQAATNKMKMDSWISTKTKKIKEQTVKGLEPELVRMTVAHQQELSELRHLHQHELKEVELRAARKTETALELFRTQMELEKETAVGRERELAKTRLEKQVEQEELSYQEHRQRLVSEAKREKLRFEQELAAAALDSARIQERLVQEHRDAMDAAARAHALDVRKVRETLAAEREEWAAELRRQKDVEVAERERKCREESRLERDKQIEMVISRLTEETSQAKSELELSANTKMRKLKEKFDADVKELEEAELAAKVKYTKIKDRLSDCEDAVCELKACNRQLEKELHEEKKLSAAFSTERAQLKDTLRAEVHAQLSALESEAQRLRTECESSRTRHDVELRTLRDVQQHELRAVHERVRTVVAQRDDTVRQLSERCTQLEALVEAQRKEYLLK